MMISTFIPCVFAKREATKRSRSETIPTTPPSATTGRCRTPCSRSSAVACSTESVGASV